MRREGGPTTLEEGELAHPERKTSLEEEMMSKEEFPNFGTKRGDQDSTTRN